MNEHDPHPPKPRETRIQPADLMQKPTVLTTSDLMDVLQVGEHTVYELVSSGRLHPLAYSRRDVKVWRGEVVAFLKRETEAAKPAKGGRQDTI